LREIDFVFQKTYLESVHPLATFVQIIHKMHGETLKVLRNGAVATTVATGS